MTDDAPSPVAVLLDEAPMLTPTQCFAAAYLLDIGRATVQEAAEATGISEHTIHTAYTNLVEADLARATEHRTESRGRNPTLYVATPPPAEASIEPTDRELKDEAVCVLARRHYRQGLSSTKAKHIADELDINPQHAANVMKRLRADGVVEVLNPGSLSNNVYRLVPPKEHVPYDSAEAEAAAD